MARITKIHNVTLTSVKGNTGRALVSVYNNVDHQGDRVLPGAFTRSIAEWEASGDPLPFIWSHMWQDPMAHIGRVTKFTDTQTGLIVDFEITDPTEFAQQVVRLLKERRVTQMSFAYDVVYERPGADSANELVELKLIECGPCLSGANEETDLLSVKAVQQMLAREAGTTTGWAGTSIPKEAVEDLRSRVAAEVEGFLDSIYDAAPKERPMVDNTTGTSSNITIETSKERQTNSEIERLNREINAIAGKPKPDDDLCRQLAELGDSKAAAPRGADLGPLAPVMLTAAARFEQNAVRALGLGLVDEADLLMQSARGLRAIVAGKDGDVQEIVDALSPVVQTMRVAGNPIAAGNLERDLVELAGGTGVEKSSVESKPKGHFTYDSPQRWVEA